MMARYVPKDDPIDRAPHHIRLPMSDDEMVQAGSCTRVNQGTQHPEADPPPREITGMKNQTDPIRLDGASVSENQMGDIGFR